jgi:predicted ester cyclase
MSSQDNKTLVRRFITEVFEQGRPEAVDALATSDFVSHGLPGTGPDVMKQAIERVGRGLSNAKFEIHEVVAEGELVAVRLMSTATQSGEFMGMPATGKTYTVEELHLFRIADGRVAEHWHQMDAMGMMKQLGASPATPGRA